MLYDALEGGARPLAPPAATRLVTQLAKTAPSTKPEAMRPILWKSVALAVATVGFVPILALQHAGAVVVYIVALVVVHLVGLGILLWGRPWAAWAASRHALAWRVLALAVLTFLLMLVGKGLAATGLVFWTSLTAVWLLHTLGVVVLHLRGRPATCPIPGMQRQVAA